MDGALTPRSRFLVNLYIPFTAYLHENLRRYAKVTRENNCLYWILNPHSRAEGK